MPQSELLRFQAHVGTDSVATTECALVRNQNLQNKTPRKTSGGLAPGSMHSRCGANGPLRGTCGGAAGVSISQVHKVSCTGECGSLAQLNDPLTDR